MTKRAKAVLHVTLRNNDRLLVRLDKQDGSVEYEKSASWCDVKRLLDQVMPVAEGRRQNSNKKPASVGQESKMENKSTPRAKPEARLGVRRDKYGNPTDQYGLTILPRWKLLLLWRVAKLLKLDVSISGNRVSWPLPPAQKAHYDEFRRRELAWVRGGHVGPAPVMAPFPEYQEDESL